MRNNVRAKSPTDLAFETRFSFFMGVPISMWRNRRVTSSQMQMRFMDSRSSAQRETQLRRGSCRRGGHTSMTLQGATDHHFTALPSIIRLSLRTYAHRTTDRLALVHGTPGVVDTICASGASYKTWLASESILFLSHSVIRSSRRAPLVHRASTYPFCP